MEAAPEYWQNPDILKDVYVRTSSGSQVPLSAFATYGPTNTALAVNHQGQFAASTISFNLPPGISLIAGNAGRQRYAGANRRPDTIHGSFQGTARAFQSSLDSHRGSSSRRC
jgi:multidrug efflux pump